jgi:hypothetical protein
VSITPRAEGTWVILTADGAVAIPGTPQAGDRMFVLATWKAFDTTAQITSPTAWTEVTEFADGSVAPAANVGSVKVGAWWRDWQSGDTQPTIDFSVSPVPAAAVMVVFAKGQTDVWATPASATAAIASADPFTATASSDPGITAGDLVIALVGIRDDSHASSTTSNDIAADAIYAIAVAGTSSAAPVTTGDLSASETGAALWIRQRITAGGDDKPTQIMQLLAH